MPIYEYRCQKCLHEFERLQKMSDEPVQECPECGNPVDRLVSNTSFALKGGGWYKDGYASVKGSTPKKETKKDTSKKSDKKS